MGNTNSKKIKKRDPILNPGKLQVGTFYKQQLNSGKDGYTSGKCKKLTRKQKCKNGYTLHFGKEQIENCSQIGKLFKLKFKTCTRKLKN
jgi:hypothetical protein